MYLTSQTVRVNNYYKMFLLNKTWIFLIRKFELAKFGFNPHSRVVLPLFGLCPPELKFKISSGPIRDTARFFEFSLGAYLPGLVVNFDLDGVFCENCDHP